MIMKKKVWDWHEIFYDPEQLPYISYAHTPGPFDDYTQYGNLKNLCMIDETLTPTFI